MGLPLRKNPSLLSNLIVRNPTGVLYSSIFVPFMVTETARLYSSGLSGVQSCGLFNCRRIAVSVSFFDAAVSCWLASATNLPFASVRRALSCTGELIADALVTDTDTFATVLFSEIRGVVNATPHK